MHNVNRTTFISRDWRPDDMHYQMLEQHNIPRHFIDDAVPEFVLYWRERNKAEFSWGSKFVKHVLHIWRRHECEMAVADRNTRMTKDWQPEKMAIEQLRSEGMGDEIIRAALNDFILYWMERGEECATWSSRFTQFARQNASRFQKPVEAFRPSALEIFNDRSWADE